MFCVMALKLPYLKCSHPKHRAFATWIAEYFLFAKYFLKFQELYPKWIRSALSLYPNTHTTAVPALNKREDKQTSFKLFAIFFSLKFQDFGSWNIVFGIQLPVFMNFGFHCGFRWLTLKINQQTKINIEKVSCYTYNLTLFLNELSVYARQKSGNPNRDYFLIECTIGTS